MVVTTNPLQILQLMAAAMVIVAKVPQATIVAMVKEVEVVNAPKQQGATRQCTRSVRRSVMTPQDAGTSMTMMMISQATRLQELQPQAMVMIPIGMWTTRL